MRWSWMICLLVMGCADDAPHDGTGGGGGGSHGPRTAPKACGTVTTLAEGLTSPGPIAFAGDAVFVTTLDTTGAHATGSGQVLEISLDGGAPKLLVAGQSSLLGVAADESTVYFTNFSVGEFGAVMTIPRGGGQLTTLVSDQLGPVAIAVDDTDVYWTALDTISRVPKGGGTPTIVLQAPDQAGFSRLVLDGDDAYFYGNPGGNEGRIQRVPKTGGTPITLASDLRLVGYLSVAGDKVYFGDSVDNAIDNSRVFELPISGSSAPQSLSGPVWLPNAVFKTQSGNLYWGSGDTFSHGTADHDPVARLTADGALEQIDPSSAYAFVACPGGVCWTDFVGGTVKRFEECP